MPGNKRNKVARLDSVIERLGNAMGVKKKGTGVACSRKAGRTKPARRSTMDGTRARRVGRTLVPRVASPIPSTHSEEESEEREEEFEEEREEPVLEDREEVEEEREEAEEREEELEQREEEFEEGEYAVEESAKDMEWPVPTETKIWLRGVSTLPS
ncbi:hypothetical protein D1007_60171 [Hordeum vulgare]|nr:hypothetical protein D1007_60171 [Hordeum vulgare]